MPDFERVIRSLDLDMATSPEEAAYLQGKHDGQDSARREILCVALGLFALWAAVSIAPSLMMSIAASLMEHFK